MSFDSLLNQSCTIQRYSLKQTDVLGRKEVWSAVFPNVKCRIEQLSDDKRLIAGRDGEVATHICYVQPATTATVKDRLISGGLTYDIVSVEESRGAKSVHHYEIILNLRR